MLLTRLYPVIKALVLVASFLLMALMAERGAADTSESDQATLAKIEDYLNGIETLKADFLQMAPDSSLAEGTVYIERPGRLRVDYDPPVPLLIVADGNWLSMIDYELKEVSRWPIDETPLKVLIKGDLNLDKDVEVLDVVRETGLVKVTVKAQGVPGQEKISFLFSTSPFQLRQWEVIDARGDATRVALANTETGVSLEKDLFTYDDPRPANRRGPRR